MPNLDPIDKKLGGTFYIENIQKVVVHAVYARFFDRIQFLLGFAETRTVYQSQKLISYRR